MSSKDLSIKNRCVMCGISERRIAQQSRKWQAHPSHASCQPTSLETRLAGHRQIANLRVFLAQRPATQRVPCSPHPAEPGFSEWTLGHAQRGFGEGRRLVMAGFRAGSPGAYVCCGT